MRQSSSTTGWQANIADLHLHADQAPCSNFPDLRNADGHWPVGQSKSAHRGSPPSLGVSSHWRQIQSWNIAWLLSVVLHLQVLFTQRLSAPAPSSSSAKAWSSSPRQVKDLEGTSPSFTIWDAGRYLVEETTVFRDHLSSLLVSLLLLPWPYEICFGTSLKRQAKKNSNTLAKPLMLPEVSQRPLTSNWCWYLSPKAEIFSCMYPKESHCTVVLIHAISPRWLFWMASEPLLHQDTWSRYWVVTMHRSSGWASTCFSEQGGKLMEDTSAVYCTHLDFMWGTGV